MCVLRFRCLCGATWQQKRDICIGSLLTGRDKRQLSGVCIEAEHIAVGRSVFAGLVAHPRSGDIGVK